MQKYIETIKQKCKEKYVELFLHYVKHIDTGPRIERKMLAFQKKVQRMMKRRGIALVAYKVADGSVAMSFVPEERWDAEKKIAEEVLKAQAEEMKKPKVTAESGSSS